MHLNINLLPEISFQHFLDEVAPSNIIKTSDSQFLTVKSSILFYENLSIDYKPAFKIKEPENVVGKICNFLKQTNNSYVIITVKL